MAAPLLPIDDQPVIIDQQHFVQNNKVLVQTHDPAYTEMLEQTAAAHHQLAIAETEAQAALRHEAATKRSTRQGCS